ncbi:MAG: hypothetical protein WEA28_11140 [Xanthobacteraceae bacterium]
MKKLLHVLLACGLTLLGVSVGTQADAQSYPSKPITIIVPFGAGSATDTITRVLGQKLSVALKQSIVVENRPGANGALAALYVARARRQMATRCS